MPRSKSFYPRKNGLLQLSVTQAQEYQPTPLHARQLTTRLPVNHDLPLVPEKEIDIAMWQSAPHASLQQFAACFDGTSQRPHHVPGPAVRSLLGELPTQTTRLAYLGERKTTAHSFSLISIQTTRQVSTLQDQRIELSQFLVDETFPTTLIIISTVEISHE